MGDARGHWEGNTLVVETTNFREETTYRGANPQTLRVDRTLHARRADKVMWAVTFDDPKTWTRPWTFAMPLTMDDANRVFEYACHEGNYGLREHPERRPRRREGRQDSLSPRLPQFPFVAERPV